MPDVTVNGVRLHYEEHGAGASILCLHGGGSSAVFWEEAAARLAALGRVILYDRRACNRSERPEPYETTSVREHADDALELLRALDAEPAALIGRSYGAAIALDVALRRPDSVLGIALLEGGLPGLSPEYDEWFASLQASVEQVASERGPEHVGETVLRDIFGAWEELPAVWRDVFTTNGPALLAEVRGGEGLSDGTRLEDLRVPALVVTADDSPTPIQRCSEAIGRALPHARSVRVPGGHAIDPAGPGVLRFLEELFQDGPSAS